MRVSPWPMAPERALLEVFEAKTEAKRWHRTYKFWQGTIEREDKHLAWTAEHVSKKNEEARRAALKSDRAGQHVGRRSQAPAQAGGDTMSGRLALAHAIEDAGIPREKAESVATAIARFVEGSAVTKAELDAAKAELKADIQAVRTEVVKLDAKVERIGDRTFNRLGVLVVVVAGVLFGALHLWPPH